MQKRFSILPFGFCLIGPAFAASEISPEYCYGRVSYEVEGARLGEQQCITNNRTESDTKIFVVENLAEVKEIAIEEPSMAFIKPVISLRVGSNWTDWGEDHLINVAPPLPADDLKADKQTQANVGLGIFLGGEFSSNWSPWHLQAGVSYDWLSSVDLKGTVYQAGSPLFTESYKYNIEHQRVAAEFKALRKIEEWYPYVTLGLGAAWNKSSNFKESNSGSVPRPALFADSTTVASFTWSVGAGVERSFGEAWRVGIGYLYTDAGKAKLEAKSASESLELNSLSINQLLLQVTYIM